MVSMREHRLVTAAFILATFAAPAFADADSRAHVVLLSGIESGEQIVEVDEDGTRRIHRSFNDRGRGPDTVAVVRLDSQGLPVELQIEGVDYMKADATESFELVDGVARWQSVVDGGETEQVGFYLPLDVTAEMIAVLARAALARDGEPLPILPTGAVRASVVDRLELDDGRTVRLVELNGLQFEPTPVWLDEDGQLFALANGWLTVVEPGSEAVAAELVARQDARRAARFEDMAARLRVPPRDSLLIDNARIWDVRAGRVRTENAVLVAGDRIERLLAPDEERPAAATVVDAEDRTLLPGLWDMHTHLDFMAGPLNIAAGVTTVRDLANSHERLMPVVTAFESDTVIGPHTFRAGLIDGTGPFAGPTKARVETTEEALRWVDFYADEGYDQIKIYSSVPVELVPVMTARAKSRGLRVSGHVPAGMWAEDAVRAGYDEIQHINMLFLNFYKDVTETRNPDRFIKVAERGADLDLEGEDFQAFVALLKERNIVVDPTVAIFFDLFVQEPGQPAPSSAAIHDRLPAQVARGALSGGLPIPPDQKARYAASAQRLLDVVAALHRAGVPLVAGTDALSGFALHAELEFYVRAGIPPADVLRLATIGAATVMDATAEAGAIEPGLRADLVLVDGRPDERMSDIRAVSWVMKSGAVYEPAAIYREIGVQP
jgi:imidazolonepropionase-like amidohydrolase